MHAAAKATIEECYAKNKAGDPKFKSLTASMKVRLRSTVGESYWKKAHDYLHLVLKQRMGKVQKQQGEGGQVQAQPHQQPQQQIPSGHHPVQSSSKHGSVPPPIVPGAAPQPSTNAKQQLQHVKTQPQSANAQPLTAEQLKAQTDEERRVRKNERARVRRAAKKKEKLEAAAKAMTERASQAAVSTNPEADAAVESTTASAGAVSVISTGADVQRAMQRSTAVRSGTPSVVSSSGSAPMPLSVVDPSTTNVSCAPRAKAEDQKATEATKKSIEKKRTTPPTSNLPSKSKLLTREASKLMEKTDHTVSIDINSLPLMLSKEHKLEFDLVEEQRTLLYGDQTRCAKVKDIAKAASAALDIQIEETKLKKAGVQPLPRRIPAMYDGWGKKNVLSARSAWARVRLPESEAWWVEKVQRERRLGAANLSMCGCDGVEDQVLLGLGSRIVGHGNTSLTIQEGSTAAPRIKDNTTNRVWFNETRAEQDPTLALLSEATELFLKSTIEKVIGQARLRQNLDGVRLWHTLHARSSANPSSGSQADHETLPAALIQLGCDVRRQIALAEGNAAKTYQRMEEAIFHQNNIAHHTSDSAYDEPNTMLLETTSIAESSKNHLLNSAAHTANVDAKRKYSVFGGMDSQEPPFGRVPKKVKVMLQDILVGELGNRRSMIVARKKQFQVGLRY